MITLGLTSGFIGEPAAGAKAETAANFGALLDQAAARPTGDEERALLSALAGWPAPAPPLLHAEAEIAADSATRLLTDRLAALCAGVAPASADSAGTGQPALLQDAATSRAADGAELVGTTADSAAAGATGEDVVPAASSPNRPAATRAVATPIGEGHAFTDDATARAAIDAGARPWAPADRDVDRVPTDAAAPSEQARADAKSVEAGPGPTTVTVAATDRFGAPAPPPAAAREPRPTRPDVTLTARVDVAPTQTARTEPARASAQPTPAVGAPATTTPSAGTTGPSTRAAVLDAPRAAPTPPTNVSAAPTNTSRAPTVTGAEPTNGEAARTIASAPHATARAVSDAARADRHAAGVALDTAHAALDTAPRPRTTARADLAAPHVDRGRAAAAEYGRRARESTLPPRDVEPIALAREPRTTAGDATSGVTAPAGRELTALEPAPSAARDTTDRPGATAPTTVIDTSAARAAPSGEPDRGRRLARDERADRSPAVGVPERWDAPAPASPSPVTAPERAPIASAPVAPPPALHGTLAPTRAAIVIGEGEDRVRVVVETRGEQVRVDLTAASAVLAEAAAVERPLLDRALQAQGLRLAELIAQSTEPRVAPVQATSDARGESMAGDGGARDRAPRDDDRPTQDEPTHRRPTHEGAPNAAGSAGSSGPSRRWVM